MIWKNLRRSHDPGEKSRSWRDALTKAGNSPWGAVWTEEVAAEARGLWVARVAPLEDALRHVKRLVVIPSGAMMCISLESLIDTEGQFAGDRFSVHYAPSATIYTWLREQHDADRRAVSPRVLLVGDPPFSPAHMSEMEAADKEDIALQFSTQEASVTAEALRSALAGNRFSTPSIGLPLH